MYSYQLQRCARASEVFSAYRIWMHTHLHLLSPFLLSSSVFSYPTSSAVVSPSLFCSLLPSSPLPLSRTGQPCSHFLYPLPQTSDQQQVQVWPMWWGLPHETYCWLRKTRWRGSGSVTVVCMEEEEGGQRYAGEWWCCDLAGWLRRDW